MKTSWLTNIFVAFVLTMLFGVTSTSCARSNSVGAIEESLKGASAIWFQKRAINTGMLGEETPTLHPLL
jgi:hypothetical protein